MNQHSIDFYHHTIRGLRGTDEFQWCLHQLAALKAQQASVPEQPQPPFAPGDTFTRGKATYRVKSVKFTDMRGNDRPEWFVTAWRFVKTTGKWSGNAYVYSLDEIDPPIVAKAAGQPGPALLTAILNGRA